MGPADDAPSLRETVKLARRGKTRTVSIPLTMPVLVTQSRPGVHSHLWVERLMDFPSARAFALALGFVDRNYLLRVARWQLNVPNPPPWASRP